MRSSIRPIASLVLVAAAAGCGRSSTEVDAPEPPAAFPIPARPVFTDDTPAEVRALADECFAAAEPLVLERPRSADGLLVLGDVHQQYGNAATATALWSRCLELDPGYVLATCRLAESAAARGDDAEAITRYRAALEIDRTAPDVRLPLAAALVRTGDADVVAEIVAPLLADHPDSAAAWAIVGKARLQAGDVRAAADAFRRAAELDPASRDALQGLGTALQRLGEIEEARVHLEAVARLQADRERGYDTATAATGDDLEPRRRTAVALANVARIQAARGAAGAAETGWRRACELDPDDAESRAALATSLAQRGQTVEALVVRQAWCEHEPTNPAAWFGYAQLALRMREIKKAEAALRAVIALAPDRPEGYALMAQLKQADDLDEAVALAARVVELAPTPPHLVFLAELSARAGDRAGARAAARRALDIDPGDRGAAAVLRAIGAGP